MVTVSNYGNIIYKGENKTPTINQDGYYIISLKCKEGWRSVRINRLVALAFIPNSNSLKNEVNHKDFNRKNNYY